MNVESGEGLTALAMIIILFVSSLFRYLLPSRRMRPGTGRCPPSWMPIGRSDMSGFCRIGSARGSADWSRKKRRPSTSLPSSGSSDMRLRSSRSPVRGPIYRVRSHGGKEKWQVGASPEGRITGGETGFRRFDRCRKRGFPGVDYDRARRERWS